MRFSPPLQVLERGPGGEVSESPARFSLGKEFMPKKEFNLLESHLLRWVKAQSKDED